MTSYTAVDMQVATHIKLCVASEFSASGQLAYWLKTLVWLPQKIK